MRRCRRTTYVVDTASGHDVDAAAVDAFYRTVLDALRLDCTQVVADLLGRTAPLPPPAREAAVALHRLNRTSIFTTIDVNPFQGVVVDECDPRQWAALLTIAPYASHLSLEGGGPFRDLFSSSGTLASVRARLRPEQHQRVAAALEAAGAPPLRPRRGPTQVPAHRTSVST